MDWARGTALFSMLLAASCVCVYCGNNDVAQTSATQRVVTAWAHEGQPAEKAALESIFAEFNRTHDDIQVAVEFKQEQGYAERVNAAAIAGELPDVIDIDGPYTATFADAGILAPITPLVLQELRDDFLPTIISQGTYKGELYTLGAFESTVVVFYNTQIASDCSISPPRSIDETWTFEEFTSALKSVKRKRPDVMPLETFMVWGREWLTYAFTPLIWSNGGRVLSEDGAATKGHLNGDAAVEALEAWQRLFTEGLTDVNATAGQFRRGEAAMCWGIFNRWPLYAEQGLPFAMAPLPMFKAPSSPSGSWCWGMTTQSKDKKAAMTVIEWLVDPRHGIVPMCKANGGVPARMSAVELMPDYHRTRRLFIEQLKRTARSRPVTPHYGALTREVSRALSDIAKGAEVKPVLDRAAEAIDAVLKAE